MKRKLLAGFVCVALLLGALPMQAFAEGASATTLYAGGVALSGSADAVAYAKTVDGAVTTEGASAEDYNIMWDGTTLTLKEAVIIEGMHENAAIYGEGDFSLVLEGTNEVTTQSVEVTEKKIMTSSGVQSTGSIEILGLGTLHVKGGDMQGQEGSAFTYGIKAGNNLSITGGTVEALGGTVTISNSISNASAGLYAVNNVTVSGGKVVATGGTAPSQSYGIWASNQDVTIAGGEVMAGADASATTRHASIFADGGTVRVAPQEGQAISVVAGDKVPGSEVEGSPFSSAQEIESLIEGATYFHSMATVTPQTHHLTVNLDGGNGATVDGDYAAGTEISVDAGAKSGHRFAGWTSTGGSFADASSAQTIFTMPDADATITANWETAQTVAIEAVAHEHGSITPSGVVHVPQGASQTFTITPEEGYVVRDVTVDGNSVGAVTSYTFENVVNPHYITATFEPSLSASPVAIDFSSLEEGYIPASVLQSVNVSNKTADAMTLTPPVLKYYDVSADSWTVEAGSQINVKITPKKGLSAGDYQETLTFTDGNGATASVALTFNVREKEKHHLTVNLDGGNGTDVSGDYAEGEKISLDAGEKSGYRFAGWTSTGGSFDDPSKAQTTFTMPDADATLTAHWEENGGGSGAPTYDIDVQATGGGTLDLSHKFAVAGVTVSVTVQPEAGYRLDALTVTTTDGDEVALNQLGDHRYSFKMPKADVTVDARFTEDGEGDCTLPFNDVHPNDWFRQPVCYVYHRGLMIGTSADTFSPNLATSRGMFVTMLYRLEGEPDISGENLGDPYKDVDADAYYADAVYWARLNGIVSGLSDEIFAPNSPLTREQLAAMLHNYAAWKGVDVSASADLSSYSDADAVSGWAHEVMQWAVAEGIVSGMTADTLAPQAEAARAQVAAIMQRFLSE